MRFYLIDRIEEIHYGESITAVKCITLADDVFSEHFPGYPVFPDSLILEGLSQLGGLFFEIMMKHDNMPIQRCILSSVNKLHFKRPARPGDKLFYQVKIVAIRDEYGVVKVKAKIEGEICAEGELTFTFVDIRDDTLQESRMELYKVWMKNIEVVT